MSFYLGDFVKIHIGLFVAPAGDEDIAGGKDIFESFAFFCVDLPTVEMIFYIVEKSGDFAISLFVVSEIMRPCRLYCFRPERSGARAAAAIFIEINGGMGDFVEFFG